MSWTHAYTSRVTNPEEAVAEIASGQRVFVTGNCSVPQVLLEALVARASHLRDVELIQVLSIGEARYAEPAMEGHIRVNTLFISDNVRRAVNEGRADFTPCLLSEIPGLFSNGILPLDVALIQVSPPDEHGFCSLGVEVGVTKTAAQSAKCVVAEVNPQMPRTLGDAFIHASKLDHIVEVDGGVDRRRLDHADGDWRHPRRCPSSFGRASRSRHPH
jgi:4-hydroxybutyrate CoA-transferase